MSQPTLFISSRFHFVKQNVDRIVHKAQLVIHVYERQA